MTLSRYLLGLAFLAAQSAAAKPAVLFAFDVYQYDSSRQADVLLLSDTVTAIKDLPASGFLVAFSLEILLTQVDTSRAMFQVHVVTLGPPAHTYSNGYTVEYGLPAIMRDIAGKASSRYTLKTTPISVIEVDTSACPFNHHEAGTFSFEPTAHTDIYYVPNSLGEYYFTAVKDLFETDYRLFKSLLNLNLPGKYNIILCPCPINSVIWDKRFGMAVDPTRATAFALFAPGTNTVDPFIVMQTAVLRHFGYAPAFLTEGLASYLSFSVFDLRELIRENRLIPLKQLLDTYSYFRTEPRIADLSSATFVKYLIDRYSLARFRALYKEADDLNLAQKLEEVYGSTITALQAEWLQFVDTLTILPVHYKGFAEKAEFMRNYPAMLRYAEAYVNVSATEADSLASLDLLQRASFLTGNYYRASEAQAALTRLASGTAKNWVTLAAYKMMNGYYEEARADLMTALSVDSTESLARFNLALNYLSVHDTLTARKLLQEAVAAPGPSGGGESRIMLANLLCHSVNAADRALATQYYNEAISLFEQEAQAYKASSTAYLWMGIAFLGLGDTGAAYDHLATARFLEARPFYHGMIDLWLGKCADLKNDRTAAREFYGRVLAVSSADYHQQEARLLLETPHRQ
ncbi:MAG TPA: hypothetical protein VN285_07700 [Candidatus Deferrimicrobium sp.]|nr:hypothetical protein [Candidatus Deferrimicrobium sp.]